MQVTKSRLSVYEARIDALEHLVLNISAENTMVGNSWDQRWYIVGTPT